MKWPWIAACLELSSEEADFYSGARKIIRNRTITFDVFRDDLKIGDAGYTKSKMSMLRRLYLHQESIDAAVSLWERRLDQGRYGSVGFTTYNHFVKSDPNKKAKRASVMGPCIQSVCLTLLNNKHTAVDVFYRTTEIFKKFPADLVFLREVLLEPFDFSRAPIAEVNFHFANITIHPMYFVTIIPLLNHPINQLNIIKSEDKYFFNWLVKWSARYVCDEYSRGIQKFSQALRVQKDARERIDPKTLKHLQKYFRDNHPGYRNDYEDSDDDD